MMSEKMATLGLPKLEFFWNKGYGVIISFDDVANKVLLRESNYTVDVVVRSKFGNSNISMKEVIITSII